MAKVYKNKLQREQDEREAAKAERREAEQKAAAERRQEKQEKREQAKIEEQKRIQRAVEKARKDKQKAREAYIKGKEELFSELLNMSDEERGKKLEEISEKRDVLRKRIEGKAEKGISDPEAVKADKELELEQKRLESVPKVHKQIEKVMEVRDSFAEKKNDAVKSLKNEKRRNNDKISKLEKGIQEKTEQNEQRKENLEKRMPEIEKRLQEIEAELKEFDEYIDYVEQNDVNMEIEQPKIDELTAKSKVLKAEKESLGKESEELRSVKLEDEIKESQSAVDELKARNGKITEELTVYANGKSKEDTVINKCNMAWMMLLDGKSWEEINLRAVESLKAKAPKVAEEKEEPASKEPETVPEPVKKAEPEIAQEPEQVPDPHTGEVDLGAAQTETAQVVEEILSEKENLPVEKKKKWADRFPGFAKSRVGKFIFGILDKKANEAEQIARIQEKLKNGTYDHMMVNDEMDDAVIVNKEPKEASAKPEPAKVPGPKEASAKIEPEEKTPMKERRDAFIDYLQEMATGEKHTENNKFASEELVKAAEAKKAEYEARRAEENKDGATR